MADDERDGPSLELPTFRLGRRRGSKDRFLDPDPDPSPAPEPAHDEAAELTAADPLTDPLPDPVGDTHPQPAVSEPAVEPDRQPVAREPALVPDAPAPRPLFVDEAPTPAPQAPAPVEPAETAPPAGGRRRDRSAGTPGGALAVVATGLLVGVLTVGLTWLSQRGCEAVQGASTCGGQAGLLLLVTILVLMVLVGTGALRLARVSDPGSTSFLGVGLLTVIALLFLVGDLFQWWAAVVVPVLSMVTFAIAHWVTTVFVEDDGR